MENTIKVSNSNLDPRNIKLDALRIVGLLCIILAHTNPPNILFQIRNFDVPLMVIISGAVFSISASGKQLSYGEYFKKRVFRLIAPTWFFLFLFFSIIYLIFLISNHSYPFSQKTIILSFALLSGIGYVWIIRVFILMASIAPFLNQLHQKIKKNVNYLAVLMVIYISYELLYISYKDGGLYAFDLMFKYVLFYLLPYGCLFGFGLRLPQLDKKSIIILMIIFLILFVVEAALNYSNHFVPTQQYKYPPRIYYLSYSIFVSLFLYTLFDDIKLKVFNNSISFFVSYSSIWIYLWHIFYIYAWDFSESFRPAWTNSFIIMFLCIVSLAIATTYLHKTLVRIFVLPHIDPKYREKFSITFLK